MIYIYESKRNFSTSLFLFKVKGVYLYACIKICRIICVYIQKRFILVMIFVFKNESNKLRSVSSLKLEKLLVYFWHTPRI